MTKDLEKTLQDILNEATEEPSMSFSESMQESTKKKFGVIRDLAQQSFGGIEELKDNIRKLTDEKKRAQEDENDLLGTIRDLKEEAEELESDIIAESVGEVKTLYDEQKVEIVQRLYKNLNLDELIEIEKKAVLMNEYYKLH